MGDLFTQHETVGGGDEIKVEIESSRQSSITLLRDKAARMEDTATALKALADKIEDGDWVIGGEAESALWDILIRTRWE